MTPFLQAVWYAWDNIVDFLMEHGADVTKTSMVACPVPPRRSLLMFGSRAVFCRMAKARCIMLLARTWSPPRRSCWMLALNLTSKTKYVPHVRFNCLYIDSHVCHACSMVAHLCCTQLLQVT